MAANGERVVRVLLVEDSPSDAALLQAGLATAGPERFSVTHAATLAEALESARTLPLDAVLLDLSLPDSAGLETVDRALAAWPEMPIVVLTGAGDESVGFEAIQHGVQDYLVKGQASGHQIARALRYAIERRRVEAEIKRVNAELEMRVAERTAQLRRLSLELTLAEQRERRRIAQLLHDNLQQLLVFSHLSVGRARSLASDSELQRILERVEHTLSEAVEVARSLSAELSPPSLYTHGLAAAVRWFAGGLREMAGLQVTVVAEEGAEAELEGHRAVLFQSVRELLTNVVKHAGVDEAVVRILRCEGDGVEISVEDTGRGFDVGEVAREGAIGGVGLFGIRERLRQLGGSCEIESGPGRGTKVTLRLPGCLPKTASPAEGQDQET